MSTKAFKKKYSIAEVVLLIIFALSLVAGHMLVIKRQKIKLCKPISLDFAGISASVPDGEGWTREGGWKFHDEDNDFMLTAQQTSNGRVVAIVQWRYIIAPEKISTFRLLAKRADVGGAEKIKTGQYTIDNTLIEWAHAKVPGGLRDVFFGVAQFGNGRSIEIETMVPSDPILAKQIFLKVCKSLKYEPNDFIEKGKQFIASIKEAGISSLIETDNDLRDDQYFIFEKPEENASGYYIEKYSDISDAEGSKVFKKDISFYVAHDDNWFTWDGFIKFDDQFDTFFQQSEIAWTGGTQFPTFVIEQTSDGVLKCVSDTFEVDRYYWPLDNAIPDAIFGLTLTRFIDSGYDDMIIDVVKGECLVVPVFVSKIPEARVKLFDSRAAYGVRVEYLNAKGKVDQTFFDENKRFVKGVRKDVHEHIWTKSDKKTITDKFKIK